MRNVKDEHGYALVTVLLIITVFMILFLSFMGQGFNSVKQNQVVEKKSLSVASAEMGVSYYQVEIQRIFESKQQLISDYIKANTSLQTNFKREAAVKLATELQSVFPKGTTQPSIPINGDPNASYQMKDFEAIPNPDTNSNKVNISLSVVGTENKKTSTLFVKMTIDLDSIANLSKIDDINNYKLPNFNTVTVDPNVKCTTLDCNKIYINGNGDFSGNNNLKDNQTIFTTGSLNLDANGNENNLENLQIHTDGNITLGKNMNQASNVVIESKGDAIFNQNLKMTGSSSLIIMKNLHVFQNLELAKTSFAYIGGTNLPPNNITTSTATIEQNLNIIDSSKMCVNGNLTVHGKIDADTKLFVLGIVKEGKAEVETIKYKVDNDKFIKECGTFIPPDFQIKWGDNVNTVIDNVTY